MTPTLFMVQLALATYVVALTIARFHGPFRLAEKFRHEVYRRRGFEKQIAGGWRHPNGYTDLSDDWVAAGVNCPICLAPYVAAILFLAPALVLAWLAAAGGAAAIYKLSSR